MSETFSGRVYRLANNIDVPHWFRDQFILGLGEELSGDLANLTRVFKDAFASWVIEVTPFEGAPKREPALLYRRAIPTNASVEEFLAGYFEGLPSPPPGGSPLPAGKERVQMAARGSIESRTMVLGIEARAFKADAGDPWYDVRYSYEYYGARVLIKTPSGFEESVWFLSGGFDEDVAPALAAATKTYAESAQGHVIAIDGPRPANSTGHVGTGLTLCQVYRHVPGGPSEFEARVVTLDAWRSS